MYYPDVFVHCGSAVASSAKVVHDAALIVEVLSESTAEIDRREKLVAYQKLPGLRGYWDRQPGRATRQGPRARTSGRQQAVAYTAGDVVPAGWVGGEAITLGKIYAGTDVA